MLRSPWDYVHHLDEFIAWAERVERRVGAVEPARSSLRWNTHKSYLLDLQARGAPIVPTVVLLGRVGRVARRDLRRAGLERGGGEARDRERRRRRAPRRGRRSRRCRRISTRCSRRATCSCSPTSPRSNVTVRCRWSCSTATSVTRCASGPRRATTGCRSITAARPSSSIRRPGWSSSPSGWARVLPTPTLYARIDLVSLGEQWHVIEAEVTEPSLWLDLAPRRGDPAARRRPLGHESRAPARARMTGCPPTSPRFTSTPISTRPSRCPACGAATVTPMRFRGPCPSCAAELREKYRGEARVVAGAEYEPTMHVTPNAVALKD